MSMVIVMLSIVVGAGWIAWKRRRRQQAYALRVSSQRRPKESAAHKAFVHGNTCLMEGKLDEARAAFYRARDLEPKHPHLAARLAEVERRQAASAVAAANATC
jgi:cytochrome c-type biogenesis protein CcmH/NrfG